MSAYQALRRPLHCWATQEVEGPIIKAPCSKPTKLVGKSRPNKQHANNFQKLVFIDEHFFNYVPPSSIITENAQPILVATGESFSYYVYK